MKPKETLIALDVGTTSVKGLLCDTEGVVLDSFAASYPTYYPDSLSVEQDAQEVFGAVVEVVKSLMARGGVEPSSVAGLVFAGILHSMVPVDSDGNALGRALIWADKRAIGQSERIAGELDVEEVKGRTGCTLHPMYYLPRLLWFRERARDIAMRTHKFVSIKEYILHRLFGRFVVDRSIASGTGLWNMHTLDWDEDLLRAAGVDRGRLSDVVETTHLFRGLGPEWAAAIGLLEGTPCIVGGADGPLAHLGSVGLADDSMSMTIGTGAALRLKTARPAVPAGMEGWCYYMAEGTWLLGGVIQDAGIVLKWFCDTFLRTGDEVKDYELLNSYAAEVDPGAGGIVFFPFLGGERCPHENPRVRGSLLGLSFNHSLKHMARALMEGISYRLFSVYRMLAAGGELDLVVTGGVLKSPVWLQIISDFFGRSLWLPDAREGSAWGAILIGLRALGVIPNLEGVSRFVGRRGKITPNEENHRVYEVVFRTYERAYGGVTNFFSGC
jgi:gluconokinase